MQSLTSTEKMCFLHNMEKLCNRGNGVSFNSFYSNPCSVKSVEYLKLLLISLGSPLVALKRDILKLTKGCLKGEKIEPT